MSDNKSFGARDERPGHLDPWAVASLFERAGVGYDRDDDRPFSRPPSAADPGEDQGESAVCDPDHLDPEGLPEVDTEVEFLDDLDDPARSPGASLASAGRAPGLDSHDLITSVTDPPTVPTT